MKSSKLGEKKIDDWKQRMLCDILNYPVERSVEKLYIGVFLRLQDFKAVIMLTCRTVVEQSRNF